jgi:DNA modification methylase
VKRHDKPRAVSLSTRSKQISGFQYGLFAEVGQPNVRNNQPNSDHTIMAVAEQSLRNGNLNKVRAGDSSIHDWYRFVLSFPPHLVKDYLLKFDIGSGKRVLDPFCGTGTTIVECKKLGIESVGIEANPMAHFASCVKVDWSPNPEELWVHCVRIANEVQDRIGFGECLVAPAAQSRKAVGGELRHLDEEANKLLLSNSISPIPLHKTLVLLERITNSRRHQFVRHERLALAKALVYSISNLHFGPEVGVGKPKVDAPVVSSWLANVKSMVNDLSIQKESSINATVHCADSRQMLDIIAPNSIDAVITSPPYPNEKDYTRTTRLESVLLGFIANKHDLRKLKQGLVRSNTRNVYKSDDDDLLVEDNQEVQRIAEQIERRRIELGKTSGFERLYARVTRLYFGGMKKHLSDLRYVLKPGAKLAYVVGDQASYLRVMIRTGQLFAVIAQSLGYEVMGIDLFRTRLSTATREQLREEVVLLRWPGQ